MVQTLGYVVVAPGSMIVPGCVRQVVPAPQSESSRHALQSNPMSSYDMQVNAAIKALEFNQPVINTCRKLRPSMVRASPRPPKSTSSQ